MWDRRVLLKSGALAMLSLGPGPRFLRRLAGAMPSPVARPKVLVPIFLRGAMDGLMAVPPLSDPNLRRWRPRLSMKASAVSGGDLLDLDGSYGLHPAFSPWQSLFREGRLAVVHGVGSPDPTRSHFDAQDFMETGTPGQRGTSSGWLNRVMSQASTTQPVSAPEAPSLETSSAEKASAAPASGDGGRRPPSVSPFRALAMSGELPRSLYGREPALAIDDLEEIDLYLPHHPTLSQALRPAIEDLYRNTEKDLLRRHSQQMFDALRLVSQEELAAYRRQRGRRYPDTRLGRSLLQIAFLIKSGVGLEIACAESDGWDTHVGQGTVRGAFAARAQELAAAVRAFWDDIEAFHDDVVVLTMTEFGRTVEENGAGGTDHGHGSCCFVLGNRVDGGKVYGDLPPLDQANLYEGRDLPVSTDFRSVFMEVTGKLFGIDDHQAVFPGWHGTPLPLLT